MSELDFPEIIAPPVESPVVEQAPPAKVSERTTLAKLDVQAVALARFGDWRPQALALVKKYTGVVFNTGTTKGYDEAVKARSEVRDPRYTAQRVSKAAKSELAKISKAIGAEEQEIAGVLAGVEEEIDAQIRAEDDRRAKVKAEAAAKEQARKDAHVAGIEMIYSYVAKAEGVGTERLLAGIAYVETINTGADVFEEFADQAEGAKQDTLARLRSMHAAVVAAAAAKAEQERLRLENERLAAELAAERARVAEAAAALVQKQKDEADALSAARAEFERERQAFAAAQAAAAAAPAVGSINPDATSMADLFITPTTEVELEAEVLASVDAMAGEMMVEELAVAAAPAQEPVAAHSPQTPAPTLTTGAVGELLGFAVTAAFIGSLGFTPTTTKGSGTHWRASDARGIRDAIVAHLQALPL